MAEKWDAYNASRQKLNKIIYRGEKLDKGEYHLVVHVCYFNSDKKMLIQQRSKHKSWGLLWDISVGGAVQFNETSQMAAQRESFEELGIKHNFDGVLPQISRTFERGFDDIYIIKKDINIKDIKFNDQEACDVKWVTEEEIYQLITKQQFLPIYDKTFIHFLFDLFHKQRH